MEANCLQTVLSRAILCQCIHTVQEFPWIATEKDFFGKPGSDYDFEAQDVPAAFAQYEAANESLQRLANKVNRKVSFCSACVTKLSHLDRWHQDSCYRL